MAWPWNAQLQAVTSHGKSKKKVLEICACGFGIPRIDQFLGLCWGSNNDPWIKMKLSRLLPVEPDLHSWIRSQESEISSIWGWKICRKQKSNSYVMSWGSSLKLLLRLPDIGGILYFWTTYEHITDDQLKLIIRSCGTPYLSSEQSTSLGDVDIEFVSTCPTFSYLALMMLWKP